VEEMMSVLLSVALGLGGAALTASARSPSEKRDEKKEQSVTSATDNVKTLLEIFESIERRDDSRTSELFDPDFEIHWPPSLPYGGTRRGTKVNPRGWSATWEPLQPTEAERKMDPRVVAAGEDEVVVLWHQRGVSSAGEHFDGEVLGLYRMRRGRLARAQMFYFDTTGAASFLARATRGAAPPKGGTSPR